MSWVTAAAAAVTAAFATTAWYGGLSLFAKGLVDVAISYAIGAIAESLSGGRSGSRSPGVQGTLSRGANIPQSFIVGRYATAGTLVYADEWGTTKNKNEYLTMVIELSNLPVRGLAGMFIDGEKVTISESSVHSEYGKRILGNASGAKDYTNYAWVNFFDGTQTTYNTFLQTPRDHRFEPLSTATTSSRFIGRGNAYVVVTFRAGKKGLWRSFPELLFEVDGINLTKPHTGTGAAPANTHNNPVDFIYTILSGIEFGDDWFFGGQKITQSQLDTANFAAQSVKCENAGYQVNGQISVDRQAVDVIEDVLSCFNGRIAESAGKFRVLGVQPDAHVMSFTDDDVTATADRTFTPFLGLSNAVNGISVTYPSPANAWQPQTAPPLLRTDLETEDDNRRAVSNVSLPFVTDPVQVQRLMKAGLAQARRARRHTITLPPKFWVLEPLDTVRWTSARNGYVNKDFVVDAIADSPDGTCVFSLTETDPTDYSWTPATDYRPLPVVAPVATALSPLVVETFTATSETVLDANGAPVEPGIRITWDADIAEARFVKYEVREKNTVDGTTAQVLGGQSFDTTLGTDIIRRNFIYNRTYEIRIAYEPDNPSRGFEWSPWLTVFAVSNEEPAVVLSDFLEFQGETVITSLGVNVSTDNRFYPRAQIRWKKDEPGEGFSAAATSDLGDFRVPAVEDRKRYIVEVKLIGQDGILGAGYEFHHTVVGKSAPPGPVTDFRINAHGRFSTLDWTLPSDLDLSHCRLKFSETTGATYEAARVLVERIARPSTSVAVPSLPGTYFIRTFDKSGNASNTATRVVVDSVGTPEQDFNLVREIVYNPTVPLQLDASSLFDQREGLFDAQEGVFDFDPLGFMMSKIATVGSETLPAANGIRIRSEVDAEVIQTSNLFDSKSGLFDSYPGLFDDLETLTDATDISVEYQAASSASFTDATPWLPFIATEVDKRFLRFRVKISSADRFVTPRVSQVRVFIEKLDREEFGRDVSVRNGRRTFTFSERFFQLPRINLTVQNGSQGMFATVKNKTVSGFTVEIYDQNGLAANEVLVDYTARGF